MKTIDEVSFITKLMNDKWSKSLSSRAEAVKELEKEIYGKRDSIPGIIKPETRAKRNSHTPIYKLVLDVISQNLRVIDFEGPDTETAARWYARWNANRCAIIEDPLYRSAIGSGEAFIEVLMATDGKSIFKYHDTRSLEGWYEDRKVDVYPQFSITQKKDVYGKQTLEFKDADSILIFEQNKRSSKWVPRENLDNPYGVVNVIRFFYNIDGSGATHGELEALCGIRDRMAQIVFDKELVRYNGAYIVRTATDLDMPEEIKKDPKKRAEYMKAQRIELSQSRLLVASGNTKFGSLPASPLSPYIEDEEQAWKVLDRVVQMNISNTQAAPANVSQGTAKDFMSQKARKLNIPMTNFGASWEDVMRLADQLEGIEVADYNTKVVWAPIDEPSFSQLADAAQKVTGGSLGVDPKISLEWLPITPSQRARITSTEYFQANRDRLLREASTVTAAVPQNNLAAVAVGE